MATKNIHWAAPVLRPLLATALLAGLHGCGTTPVASSVATSPPASRIFKYASAQSGTVPVWITRDAGVMGSLCATRILVDGQLAALIQSGERVELNIPAGTVVLGAEANALCSGSLVETEAVLAGTGPVRFRVAYSSSATLQLSRTAAR